MSDHLPNFAIIFNVFDKCKKTKRQVRDFSSFDEASYRHDLSQINVQSCLTHDINGCFTKFNDLLMKVIDKHAPKKVLSNKEFGLSQKPWIDKNLQHKIQAKNMYYARYVRTKNVFWFERYKHLRKETRKEIFIAKKQHFCTFFNENLGNLRKIWNAINQCLLNRSKKSTSQIFLNENGEIITDQKTVAKKFNVYFTTVAEKLVEKIAKVNNKYQDYLKKSK